MAVGETLSIKGPVYDGFSEILTPAALEFVANLQRKFGPARENLLAQRAERQKALDEGEVLDFLPETAHVRAGDWQVAPAPPDLLDRRVEITGPVDRKMVINALNSGAKVFMADFEDATCANLGKRYRGPAQPRLTRSSARLSFVNPDGRVYRLNQDVATLLVRPREAGTCRRTTCLSTARPFPPACSILVSTFSTTRERLVDAGTGPYFYLPKLQSHLEARLWNDVFVFAQDQTGDQPRHNQSNRSRRNYPRRIRDGRDSLRAQGTLSRPERRPMGFHIQHHQDLPPRSSATILPDRAQVTMAVPFMRAYTNLLRQNLPPPRCPRHRRNGRLHPKS